MLPPFKLQVPVDGEYRNVGFEMARKYADLAGAPASDAGEFVDALRAAVGSLSASVPAGTPVELQFQTTGHGLAVSVQCGGRSTTVTQTVPARPR